ncbi:hypothetical protein PIB30_006758 [Stylosanthes scabra]|uniref:Uncharacterized protein n=1 Tax=Stylosanthes scabra TaxID=79078 RepID=A0ABU6T454_9FABA|nr:hypothetical protein [Stylosanthes scabra]
MPTEEDLESSLKTIISSEDQGGYPRPDRPRLIPYAISSAPFGGFDVTTSPSVYMPPPRFKPEIRHLSNPSNLPLVLGDMVFYLGAFCGGLILNGQGWLFVSQRITGLHVTDLVIFEPLT